MQHFQGHYENVERIKQCGKIKTHSFATGEVFFFCKDAILYTATCGK